MIEIDEPITITSYDATWPQLFEQEKPRLRSALGDMAIDIQHFGSTAIPNLAAKPIIDILIGLPLLELEAKQVEALKQIGYEYLGEAGVAGRLAFRKRHPHAFNLAVVQWRSQLWQDNILLRDYLRVHSQAVHRYEQHKYELMRQGVSTLLKYSERKSTLIAELLAQARAWNDK